LTHRPHAYPAPEGLYDPAYEHDACGVAFVARLDGRASHETVVRALSALSNLEHRGASGADAATGDGAGILLQIPHMFFSETVPGLPEAGRYGVGSFFLPGDDDRRRELEELVERTVAAEGQRFVCWRDVPADLSQAGTVAAGIAPVIRQAFVAAADGLEGDALERKLYVIRRVAELAAGPDLVVPSLSSRTLVYKGMLTAPQLERFYLDLSDPRVETALALVHSRYSTNTFPSWELAHPYRYIAHNGASRSSRRSSSATTSRRCCR
jgi:glutamate synthase (NADPH) large chain